MAFGVVTCHRRAGMRANCVFPSPSLLHLQWYQNWTRACRCPAMYSPNLISCTSFCLLTMLTTPSLTLATRELSTSLMPGLESKETQDKHKTDAEDQELRGQHGGCELMPGSHN